MKIKDIERLAQISDMETRTIRSELASHRASRDALQKRKDDMNHALEKMRVDVCDPCDRHSIGSYMRHIALKNMDINREIAQCDSMIDSLTEKLRDGVREEKKLDILLGELNRLQKIRLSKAEDERNDLFSTHLFHKEDKN